MIEPIVRNAEWLLFVGVLANQAGVPVPIAPWLLAAGVLAASGHLSLIGLVAGAAGATLGADLGWYGLGRCHGAEALTRLLRAFRQPPATVDRVLRVFRAHHFGFVWTARFLPELNPILAGLAGVTGVGLPRFLLYASGSAFTWVGVWVGAGFLLAGSLAGSPDGGASAAGLIALILTATAGGALGLLEWLRRRRFRREVDEERTSLLELEPAAQRRPAHRNGDGARSAGSSPPDVLDLAERATAA
jgi:membrane protein DedA with SNARE-associated domain